MSPQPCSGHGFGCGCATSQTAGAADECSHVLGDVFPRQSQSDGTYRGATYPVIHSSSNGWTRVIADSDDLRGSQPGTPRPPLPTHVSHVLGVRGEE